jgi:hypothetical protein
MFSTSKKSLRGNKCAQVFTTGAGYNLFYSTRKKSEVGEALNAMVSQDYRRAERFGFRGCG